MYHHTMDTLLIYMQVSQLLQSLYIVAIHSQIIASGCTTITAMKNTLKTKAMALIRIDTCTQVDSIRLDYGYVTGSWKIDHKLLH